MYKLIVIPRWACGGRGERPVRLQGGLALVLLVSSCLPLEDLSAYKAAAASPTQPAGSDVADAIRPVEPNLAGNPPEASAPHESVDEALPGATALDPVVGFIPPSSRSCDEAFTGCAEADAASPPSVVSSDASAPVADAGVSGCAVDEKRGPNGNCYLTVLPTLSWPAARANCQARAAGWDLATLRSGADSVFASALLSQREAWVGATDQVNEGAWTWVTDGAGFWVGDGLLGAALNGAYINWFIDEPNGADSSDCLRVLIDSAWGDLECSELRSSLCEGPSLERLARP